MKLPKTTAVQKIEIWAPRYKDRTVLIATRKVGDHNIITFTKAKHLPDKYYIEGKNIRKYPKDTNGKIPCYAVSMDELILYEGREDG